MLQIDPASVIISFLALAKEENNRETDRDEQQNRLFWTTADKVYQIALEIQQYYSENDKRKQKWPRNDRKVSQKVPKRIFDEIKNIKLELTNFCLSNDAMLGENRITASFLRLICTCWQYWDSSTEILVNAVTIDINLTSKQEKVMKKISEIYQSSIQHTLKDSVQVNMALQALSQLLECLSHIILNSHPFSPHLIGTVRRMLKEIGYCSMQFEGVQKGHHHQKKDPVKNETTADSSDFENNLHHFLHMMTKVQGICSMPNNASMVGLGGTRETVSSTTPLLAVISASGNGKPSNNFVLSGVQQKSKQLGDLSKEKKYDEEENKGECSEMPRRMRRKSTGEKVGGAVKHAYKTVKNFGKSGEQIAAEKAVQQAKSSLSEKEKFLSNAMQMVAKAEEEVKKAEQNVNVVNAKLEKWKKKGQSE